MKRFRYRIEGTEFAFEATMEAEDLRACVDALYRNVMPNLELVKTREPLRVVKVEERP